jgi:hypothetical protein
VVADPFRGTRCVSWFPQNATVAVNDETGIRAHDRFPSEIASSL